MEIVRRFFHATDRNYFLFGPRGTGKSTLVKKVYPHGYVFDLLQPELVRSLNWACYLSS